MPVETVQEEQNVKDEDEEQQPAQMPAAGLDDEGSAGTEAEEAPEEAEWTKVVENLWNEYDADGSGFLDREEMVPLAQAALAQIGYDQELDPVVIDAFF